METKAGLTSGPRWTAGCLAFCPPPSSTADWHPVPSPLPQLSDIQSPGLFHSWPTFCHRLSSTADSWPQPSSTADWHPVYGPLSQPTDPLCPPFLRKACIFYCQLIYHSSHLTQLIPTCPLLSHPTAPPFPSELTGCIRWIINLYILFKIKRQPREFSRCLVIDRTVMSCAVEIEYTTGIIDCWNLYKL